MSRIDEPISRSAPLARRMAPRLCRTDPETGESCAWYHGLWQELRMMGLAVAPEHHAGFFLRAFRALANPGRSLRVLISGAADYGLLAHVLRACEGHRFPAQVTVVDLCDTPLFLNNWYAERLGHRIHTVRASILDYESPIPFDVVCNHSFLGQFPPRVRAGLAGKWFQLLSPGGTVLAANRIRAESSPHKVSFSEDQARAFCSAVRQKAQNLKEQLQAEPEDIVERAGVYARRLYAYPISAADLKSLFERAGFRMDDLARVVSGDPGNGDIGGPAIPRNAEHACLTATRPR